jgi:hypothetical protein
METRKDQGEQERRVYEAPAVVYEAALEVRAGSGLSVPNPLNELTDPARIWK